MTNTLMTTGETMVVPVSSYDYTLFTQKLAHMNKQLAKWGLPAARVISSKYVKHAMSEITGNDSDEGHVYRYHMQVEVPVSSVKIEGHTLVGVIEDLGAGQRILTGMVMDTSSLPACPYPSFDPNAEGHDQYASERQNWVLNVYSPALEALKDANSKLISPLRNAPMTCVHCGTNRSRKKTLVFQKTDGSLVQVGKDCATEYLGINLQSALSCTWDLMERCGGTPKRFSPAQFHRDLFLAYWLITNFGYVSAKVEESYREQAMFVPVDTPKHVQCSTRTLADSIIKALNGADDLSRVDPDFVTLALKDVKAAKIAAEALAEATKEGTWSEREPAMYQGQLVSLLEVEIPEDKHLWTSTHYASDYLRARATQPEMFDAAMADVTNYWMNLEVKEGDEFNANVKAVCLAEANKSFAMTSMVVLGYLKATTDLPRAAFFVPAHRRAFPAMPADGYLGEVGAKITVEITVTDRRCGGDYERWYLIKGRTAENFEVSMFCKRGIFDSALEGETLKLKAKVKEHQLYQGRKSTAIFYAKVVE